MESFRLIPSLSAYKQSASQEKSADSASTECIYRSRLRYWKFCPLRENDAGKPNEERESGIGFVSGDRCWMFSPQSGRGRRLLDPHTMCQPSGMTPAAAMIWAPPIAPSSQIDAAPLSLRHRMSAWPLPSKSPVSEICQLLGTTPAADTMWAPPICPSSQIDTAPLSLRQRMSS